MQCPRFLIQLKDGYMAVVHVIGLCVSTVVLTVLWTFLFGAYAIALKLAGLFVKRPLPQTYWKHSPDPVSDLSQQF